MPKQRLTKRADGRYARYYHGKYFYGTTQAEATAKMEQFKRDEEQGLKYNAVMTVAQYAAAWLPVAKAAVSNKCYNDYAKQLDAMIGMIGSVPIRDVGTTDVLRVYTHFIGYSESTIHRARMLYISMFDAAAEDGYCRLNPFRSKNAQPHQGTSGTHRLISAEEREAVMNVQHRAQLIALFMLFSGLRRGEALAINIDRDIDFQQNVIHVRYAIRYDSNQAILSDPKTEAGKRDVPLLPILRNVLIGHHGLLFSSVRHPDQYASQCCFDRGWESYQKAIGFKLRCHDLRHTYCTMLRDSGIELKVAMRWMGHADEKMILKIYDHITEDRIKK